MRHERGGRRGGVGARLAPYWVPTFVLAAYLPDLPGVLAPTQWVATARVLGHSLLFAAIVGPLVALLLAGLGLRFRPALVWSLASILAHDALDLAQTTDRQPWWPFSDRRAGLGWELVPRATWVEAAVYAAAAGLVMLGLHWVRGPAAALRRPTGRQPLAAWGLTATLMVAAYLTQAARADRERAYAGAEDALRRSDFTRCLGLLGEAERWPATWSPGRIDYLRGEAYAGLRQPARAEEAYLRSYRAEPGYFWLVADLAAFYAGTDRSLEERRRLVEPLLARLKDEFRDEPGLPEALWRIERRLAGRRAHLSAAGRDAMKVAVVTSYPRDPLAPRGGVESVSVNLVRGLARRPDLEIEVVTTEADRTVVEVEEAGGFRVHRLPRGKGPLLREAVGPGRRRVQAYLRDLHPDVVHSHDVYGLMVKGFKAPRVFTVHGFIHADTRVSGQRFPLLRALLWQFFEVAGWRDQPHVISISPYVRERLTNRVGGRIHDIDNPVAEGFFEVESRPRESRIFSAALVEPRKNTLGLVEAFGLADLPRSRCPPAAGGERGRCSLRPAGGRAHRRPRSPGTRRPSRSRQEPARS